MKWLAFAVLLLSVCSMAAEAGQVRYLGGTLDNSIVGAIGHLNLSSERSMTYETGKSRFTIPYERIVSYQYTEEVTHHLGVLPSIAWDWSNTASVGMFLPFPISTTKQ
jgi:hypothetical protein